MTYNSNYFEFKPGDVFRDYTYKKGFFGELDPCAGEIGDEIRAERPPGTANYIKVDDMKGAVRVEMIIEYWSGHRGTTGKAFAINNHEWVAIPQPENTPTEPECYFHTVLGTPGISIPLEYLNEGENVVCFKAGSQIERHDFKFGFYWVYSFTIRVYYDDTKPQPAGIITFVESKDNGNESPVFSAVVNRYEQPIVRVDYVGYYFDFDWKGMGNTIQWQYQLRYGEIQRHIGSSFSTPYSVVWDMKNIPDQEQSVKVVGLIVDITGITYVTPLIEMQVIRERRSVKMYKAYDIPEAFGAHWWFPKLQCKIDVNDNLVNAKSAWLTLATWSAYHAEGIGLNEQILVENVGKVHDYSADIIEVPIEIIKRGTNIFHIQNVQKNHPAEVNWPGPALFVEFEV